MSVIDRQITLARTTDGYGLESFGCRVRVFAQQAQIVPSEIDPTPFANTALETWRAWSKTLPMIRRNSLVSEVGLVVDNGEENHYGLVHSAGAVLALSASDNPCPALDPIGWMEVPDAPVVLGPSATLTLVDFLLDGATAEADTDRWPFSSNLIVEDTPASPYPPQGCCRATTIRPAALFQTDAVEDDDTAFMLLQRTDRWQRPVNALYNFRRRNLAVTDRRTASPPRGSMIVLDGLTPESDPTPNRASWLATWRLKTSAGRRWGVEPIAIVFEGRALLDAAIGALGCPAPACIADPIDGYVFGAAPALLLRRKASDLSADPVRS